MFQVDPHNVARLNDSQFDPFPTQNHGTFGRYIHQNVPALGEERYLLLALFRRQGDVVSRAELLDEVWRYANTDVMTRTVDTHVAELRRKLEDDPTDPRHLLTVRKSGYRLVT